MAISAPASWASGQQQDHGGLGNLSISPKSMKVLIGASVTLALAAALGVLPGGFGAGAEPTGPAGESAAYRVEQVRDGDSLWAIATRAMPDREPAAAVRELRALNGSSAVKLYPGQIVLVP